MLRLKPYPKRLRKLEEGILHSERNRTAHLDTESWQFRSRSNTGHFRTGQSVLHWWAGWFASATEPPTQLKKKSRPVWFDATIIMALGVCDVTYAGRQWRDPCYQVH